MRIALLNVILIIAMILTACGGEEKSTDNTK